MEFQDEKRKNNPRKHHFLPASYLRNFSSADGRLYVYERGKPPRTSAPQAEAYIRDFYAYDGESGKAFEIEEILSRYESQAAPVIQGIIDEKRVASADCLLLLRPKSLLILRPSRSCECQQAAGSMKNTLHRR